MVTLFYFVIKSTIKEDLCALLILTILWNGTYHRLSIIMTRFLKGYLTFIFCTNLSKYSKNVSFFVPLKLKKGYK